MKIRTWDNVIIISWKDKKKIWKVLKVFNKTNKILVEWVNIVTKHIKKSWTTPGKIVKMEKAIDISNAAFLCTFTKKQTKIWFVMKEKNWKNKKFRYSKIALKEKWGKAENYIIS